MAETERQEAMDAFCGHIAGGMSVTAACGMDGAPSRSTVFRWLADSRNGRFRNAYLLAQDCRVQLVADEILAIADAPEYGTITKTSKRGTETTTMDSVQRRKLKIETRQWMLARMAAKKYGKG